MTDRLDAVIAGGGPVGLTLALAAAQAGARVRVLESRAPGTGFDDARNLALSRGSWLRLERLGIVDALTTATPIRTVHVSQRARAGRTVLDARDLGTDALGYTVAYGDLVQALDTRARSLGLVRYGSAAEAIESTPNGPIVTVGSERIAASAAFIADGGGPLPQALGLGSTTKSYGTHALVARATPERAHRNVAYERFTPHGPLALLPSGDAFVVVWTLPPDLAAPLATADDADFLSRLQAAFGWRAGRFVAVDSRAEYPLQLKTASTAARGPVALVGNAA